MDAKRVNDLLDKCTSVEVFRVEDRMFLGYYPEVIKHFINNNPTPADFYVWVQKNYKEVITSPVS